MLALFIHFGLFAQTITPNSLSMEFYSVISLQGEYSDKMVKPDANLVHADPYHYSLPLKSKHTGERYIVMVKIWIDDALNKRITLPQHGVDQVNITGSTVRVGIDIESDSIREIQSGSYELDFLITLPVGVILVRETIDVDGFNNWLPFEIRFDSSEWDVGSLLNANNKVAYIDIPSQICFDKYSDAVTELSITSPTVLVNETGAEFMYHIMLFNSLEGASNVDASLSLQVGRPIKLLWGNNVDSYEQHDQNNKCMSYFFRLSAAEDVNHIPPGRYQQILTFLLSQRI